jgi:5-methyltetrahydrofolate--homocysteine methyltransferase
MEQLCQLFQREGMTVPILVGGATTSVVHTAVKLAPLYDALVVYGGDASQTSVLAKRMEIDAKMVEAEVKQEQQLMRATYEEHHVEIEPYDVSNHNAPRYEWASIEPADSCLTADNEIDILAVKNLIDWRMFLLFWGFKGETLQQLLVNPEAEKTLQEGQQYLEKCICDKTVSLRCLADFEPAVRRGNDIVLQRDQQLLPMLRNQTKGGKYRCLADFFDTERSSTIGLFVVTCEPIRQPAADDERLMIHALCARLAEAGAEWLQRQYYGEGRVLRAAFGYATCPDHSLKRIVVDRLDAERRLGIILTDHYSIKPSTSVCGLFIAHPQAHYFTVGRIDYQQLEDYCCRRGIDVAEGEQQLSKFMTDKS